ncbi:hypothetical protein OCU04_006304 [Sclerotinia nivalis]|uniref:Uncharacterized protein n=1 Tax=Sclerotinia nivalis TaxID=352851 RepID=A0A9X0DJW0_9HELO|nr:hypothetical protein OCU04_006304 [Sclerotinia nivalis]
MTPERKWKRELEKDKAKLAELNTQYENHETILLEKLYHSKKRFEKISDKKCASLVRWKNLINSAAENSTLKEPAEFKALEHGKRRPIKIGPKTSAQEVKKALAMHDGSRYNETKKREIAEWKRSQEDIGARMVDILRKKNRILGFSSSEKHFDSCFDESACNPHTAPKHVVHHTSSRQPSPDKRFENENPRLLEQLSTVKRQLKDLTEDYRTLEYEKFKLVQDNAEISDSLKSTQDLMKQIAENRDEHVQTNRRYAEENKKLEAALESAQSQVQTQTQPCWNPVRKVTFDDTNVRLKEEVKSLSSSLAKMKSSREPHDILRDVRIESRLEFLRTSKAHGYPVIQHHSDHRIISRGQSGLNIHIGAPGMGTGASSPHGGNVRADAALLITNSNHRAKFEQTFQQIYGVALDDVKQGCTDKFAPQSKVTEMVNLRGTMAHLGCFTEHTPDKDADDRFLTLSEYCESEYECTIRRSSTNLQAAKAFSNDSEIIEACNTMREICDAVVERTKVDGPHSFMSGGINGKYI